MDTTELFNMCHLKPEHGNNPNAEYSEMEKNSS